MNILLSSIIANKEFVVLISIIIPVWQFLYSKRNEQKQIEFENFHEKILKKLSNLGKNEALDSQIAIVYEMRNYPRYYLVSKRILTRLHKKWKSEKSNEDLLTEIKLTIDYMNLNLVQRIANKLLVKQN